MRRLRGPLGNDGPILLWLLLPAAIVFTAFFLLPLGNLFLIGGSGARGWAAYTAVADRCAVSAQPCVDGRAGGGDDRGDVVHFGVTGVFLTRARFRGRALLAALLTLPLAFPGVVIGFMVIMLAGRQGLIPDISERLIGERIVFAYSMAGLFLGYLYFSIPRTILTVMAAAEKLDLRLEEAARSLGAGPLRVVSDVIVPGAEACVVVGRCDLLCDRDGRIRHRVHAGDANQCVADGDLHRVHAAGEHRDGGCAVIRARRTDVAGAGDGAYRRRHHRRGGRIDSDDEHAARSIWFWPCSPSRSSCARF